MSNRHAPTVIIASKAGRLGNRLFLSAYFMAHALEKGYQLMNPALGEYAEMFEGSAGDPFCRFPQVNCHHDVDFSNQYREVFLALVETVGSVIGKIGFSAIRLLDIRSTYDVEDRVYDLHGREFEELIASKKILLVKGWKFRDDRNLLRFHPEIRRYFTPIPSVRREAEEVVKRARSQGERLVGVHIRQGDYREWKGGMYYFETAQYAHWMNEMAKAYPHQKTTFIVCSSDPIDREQLRRLSYVEGPGKVVSDLHVLSLCDAIMGPPSTFSTWASYFGRVPLYMLEHQAQEIHPKGFAMHDRV